MSFKIGDYLGDPFQQIIQYIDYRISKLKNAVFGIVPTQTGQSGKVLSTNGTTTSWVAGAAPITTAATQVIVGTGVNTAAGSADVTYDGTTLRIVNGLGAVETLSSGEFLGVRMSESYNLAMFGLRSTFPGLIGIMLLNDRMNLLSLGPDGVVATLVPHYEGTGAPTKRNILDDAAGGVTLNSVVRGLTLHRMTKAQRNAIPSPVAGTIVYQTDNTPGLRCWNGTNWMRFTETADA